MPEPVSTGSEPQGSPSEGSPAAAAEPVATGDAVVPKERLDGLMSSFNKEKAAREAAEAKLAALEKEKQEAAAATLSDEMREYVARQMEQAKAETQTVFRSLKEQTVKRLAEQYPYADVADAQGSSPEEWEASMKQAHERVEKIVVAEAKAKAEEAERRVREQYGVPPGVGGVSEAQARGLVATTKEDLERARKSGDPVAFATALLLSPVDDTQ